jgi:translation initiation factor IF-1
MKNNQNLEVQGEIVESLPNTMFRVKLAADAPDEFASRTLLCTLSGRMRMYRIRVMPGDEVTVEVTPYDKDRGRITFRKR